MNISDFGPTLLNGAYIGILWLFLSSCIETPFSSLLHHSNTPTLHELKFPAEPTNSAVARRTKIFDNDVPKSDRLRSSSGPDRKSVV